MLSIICGSGTIWITYFKLNPSFDPSQTISFKYMTPATATLWSSSARYSYAAVKSWIHTDIFLPRASTSAVTTILRHSELPLPCVLNPYIHCGDMLWSLLYVQFFIDRCSLIPRCSFFALRISLSFFLFFWNFLRADRCLLPSLTHPPTQGVGYIYGFPDFTGLSCRSSVNLF